MNLVHAFAAAAMLVSGPAFAQDRDTQEVQNYVLTEAGLAKYTQATKQLAALESGIPGECDDDSDSTSLDSMAAKLDSVPAVKAAIQSAGMTTREYAVFTWSILHNGLAAWALSQPGGKLPPGATKANVDFYRNHEAGFKELEALTQGDGCEVEAEAEE